MNLEHIKDMLKIDPDMMLSPIGLKNRSMSAIDLEIIMEVAESIGGNLMRGNNYALYKSTLNL